MMKSSFSYFSKSTKKIDFVSNTRGKTLIIVRYPSDNTHSFLNNRSNHEKLGV